MTVGNVSCFSPIGHTAGGGGGILRRGSLHRPVRGVLHHPHAGTEVAAAEEARAPGALHDV